MENLAPDYGYWRDVVANNPEIFTSESGFKHELSENRDDFVEAGVIIEIGNGEHRKRVLVSPTLYVRYWAGRGKRHAHNTRRDWA